MKPLRNPLPAKRVLKSALRRRRAELRRLLTGAGRADPELHRELAEVELELERALA